MAPVVGVDEAGRGPVLGSMFVAAVHVPGADHLPDGVTDSKAVSADRRAAFVDEMRAIDEISAEVVEVPAAEIDREAGSLNQLTAGAQAEAVGAILETVNGPAPICLVDACDVDADRFGRWVAAQLPDGITVSAEHGGDETHAIVGAASLVAKAEREAHVDRLATEYGAIGSGYPSDPTTTAFLEEFVAEHGRLPECARRSWKTCAELRTPGRQGTLRKQSGSEVSSG